MPTKIDSEKVFFSFYFHHTVFSCFKFKIICSLKESCVLLTRKCFFPPNYNFITVRSSTALETLSEPLLSGLEGATAGNEGGSHGLRHPETPTHSLSQATSTVSASVCDVPHKGTLDFSQRKDLGTRQCSHSPHSVLSCLAGEQLS